MNCFRLTIVEKRMRASRNFYEMKNGPSIQKRHRDKNRWMNFQTEKLTCTFGIQECAEKQFSLTFFLSHEKLWLSFVLFYFSYASIHSNSVDCSSSKKFALLKHIIFVDTKAAQNKLFSKKLYFSGWHAFVFKNLQFIGHGSFLVSEK